MIFHRWAKAALIVAVVLFFADLASAAPPMFRRAQQPGAGGVVSLPYMFNDGNGTIWRIYNGGWVQQQGNTPLYSQGVMLLMNGNQLNENNNNQGRIDEKTGELVLENIQAGNVTFTRRILFDKETGVLRYIDIVHNNLAQEQTVNFQIQTNLNYGINSAQMVPDPKKKDQNLAWVAQTQVGACVMEMYAGKGAKFAPVLNWQQGNNMVQATFATPIAAGKDVAFMHLHKIVATADAGTQFATGLKESDLLKSLPSALRRIIINFPNSQGWIGDVELLRGDLLDVVELRSGDQFKGTLKEPAYDLQTIYGPVKVPVEKVVGIINIGQFRPRQLVVTSDGQIFGGRLKKDTLDLVLSSGQTTQIPLAQVSRAGYRKRAGEPEEWTFDRPMVLMRTGERMVIKPTAMPMEIATRYGKLALNYSTVAAISLQNEESGVHEVFLTDGSRFAGLLSADEFSVTLDANDEPVKFPASAVARIQLTKAADIDEMAPTIHLLNDDLLIGNLTGKLNIQTAFDTIAVSTAEIRSMTRVKETVQDVQVVLWDGTSLSGQLQETELNCELKSGLVMKTPVALLEEYIQPQPLPSPSMTTEIKGIIAELNADDWKQRDRAQAKLLSMGPVAATVLKQLRAKQPAEAQKAIDIILQKFEEQRKKEKGAGGPAAGGAPTPAKAIEEPGF